MTTKTALKKIVRAITRFKNNYCIVTHKPSDQVVTSVVHVIIRKLKCLKKDVLFFGEKGNFS